MKTSRKIFILACYLVLGILLSCEIEDEYSNPGQSEQLGTKVYTANNPPVALLWAETTNEVIVVNTDGITAIDAKSKKTRKLPFDPSYFTTQSAWIVGNTIYQVNTNGGLSKIDLTTLSYTGTLVDSASFYIYSSPFTATHFAYGKYKPEDMYLPSVFLYDLTSRKEIYVGAGLPYVFSPDGNQLVFSNNTKFYVYNLTTKAITALNFSEDYGFILYWTTDGILSFRYQGEFISVRNESTSTPIGRWECARGMYGSAISPSGQHIITRKLDCTHLNTSTGICQVGKLEHAIANIYTGVEVPMIYTVHSQISLTVFSPDEKNFAFATSDNNIYVSEPQN